MTTSRAALVLVALLGAGGAFAQSAAQDLTWALTEFSGQPEWAARLPLLLVDHWTDLDVHALSPREADLWTTRTTAQAVAQVEKEEAQLRLALDRRRLAGPLPSTEPAATEKALADLRAKSERSRSQAPPATLALRPVWASGRSLLPWPSEAAPTAAARAGAVYLVTGEVRSVGPAVSAQVWVYSTWEDRILDRWEGVFSPDEAAQAMAQAADALRSTLLGRSWARLVVRGDPGTRVRVADVWHPLPWSSALLTPGDWGLTLDRPGTTESRTVTLDSGTTTTLAWDSAASGATLVVDTVPPGGLVYIDSRYLGPAPQTIERPSAQTRVRVEAPGRSQTWEVGPNTPSPLVLTLDPPRAPLDVSRAKDEFYLSLAAFSASLTSTAFAGAWNAEQVRLANAYAEAGDRPGFDRSLERYTLTGAFYVSGIVLTSGVFVWMMFELGDYLAAAQGSLP